MEMLESLQKWLKEDFNGKINMAINLMILLAIMTTCSKVSDVDQRTKKIESQTQASIQPIQSDTEQVMKRFIEAILLQMENKQ